MAKILFFNIPAHGHINVTLPVVQELVRRGHEIIYYCTEEFRGVIEKTGVTYRSYPAPVLTWHEIAKATENIGHSGVLMLQKSEQLAPFAIQEIEREQPDLVMFDAITFWGRVAAIKTGVPSAATFSILVLEGAAPKIGLRDLTHMVLGVLAKMPRFLRSRARLARMYGAEVVKVPLFPVTGDKNIVFVPREFQFDAPFIDERFVFVGPSINPQTRDGDEWQESMTQNQKPLVYVSLGTMNNTNLAFYHEVFAAFRDYPAQFVLAAGKNTDLTQLQPIPDNFIVRNYVPQLQVLQQADAFITHGGMNSVQEGLYYGVPEIVVPQQLEQLINGRQVAAKGVGILLGDKPPYGRVNAAELRAALDELLSRPQYKQEAERLSQAAHAAGGYQRAADEVEALFRQQSVRLSRPASPLQTMVRER